MEYLRTRRMTSGPDGFRNISKGLVYTITLDSGKEFAGSRAIEEALERFVQEPNEITDREGSQDIESQTRSSEKSPSRNEGKTVDDSGCGLRNGTGNGCELRLIRRETRGV